MRCEAGAFTLPEEVDQESSQAKLENGGEALMLHRILSGDLPRSHALTVALALGIGLVVAAVGDRRARAVARAHRTLSFQLSGCQLGITVTTLLTGYIAEPAVASLIVP